MNNYYEIFEMYLFLEDDDHTKINFVLLIEKTDEEWLL